jgi:glycosyltransferase involved in cell wall biosynthesis
VTLAQAGVRRSWQYWEPLSAGQRLFFILRGAREQQERGLDMRQKRHRLLFTISEFMYSSQVRNICDLVSRLDRDLFDIEIGALRVGDEATGEIAALGVPYFKFRLQPTRPMRAHDVGTMLVSPFVLAAKRYDLVHSLLYQSIFTEAWLVKYLGRAKYVYTKSNLEWANHPGQWRRKSALSDRIISISEATSELLREKGFGDRIEKIYLGIDTDRFSFDADKRAAMRQQWQVPADAFVYGCVAQFVEWKEHLTVVKAFEQLADRHADAWLLICGPDHDDAYYHSCVDYIQNSRHKQRIRLLGTLKDMQAFYSMIDVFVLASRFETFGYAYVEAMSCGRPAIGCRAAGPLEIIDEGRTGYFCKMSDPADLAAQMLRYADDRAMVHAHGEQARQRVIEVFSRETMARNCQNLYLRMLGAA